MRDAADFVTAEPGGWCARRFVDLKLFRILENRDAHANKSLACNDCFVPDGSVHTEETIWLDSAATGDDHMGGDHYVVFDDTVVADMISTPHHDVVAKLYKRLNGIVLEDKTIVAAFKVGKSRGLGANVADKFISSSFGVGIFFRPDMIHPLETHGNKHLELVGRIDLFDFVIRDDRQALVFVLFEVVAIQRKGDHLMRRVMCKVEMCQFSPLTNSENHDFCHQHLFSGSPALSRSNSLNSDH